jgi:hypothetical protein
MTNYIAVMQVDGQTVTKYQPFETKLEADAHIEAFSDRFPSAFVIAYTGTVTKYHIVDPIAKTITLDAVLQNQDAITETAKAEINRLEAFISERRKREALLGNAEAIAFIQGVEDDIAIERAKL